MEILAIEDLSFTYPLCEKKAIENISFTVSQGDFVTICGATGSGKSTLARMIKPEVAPLGEKSGRIIYKGVDTDKLDKVTSACKIGYVNQHIEHQTVVDKVWHELAFGLENMGIEGDIIHRRVAEMSSYFGIEEWFDKSVCELSGGQAQLLNLASVMIMQPDILILDEPTSQLDPIALSDFVSTLKKLNRELLLTVIIVEHSLEELVCISDKLVVLDNGKISYFGKPELFASEAKENSRQLMEMPVPMRVFCQLGGKNECPLDVSNGRKFIEANYENKVRKIERKKYVCNNENALEFDNVYFRYSRNGKDILKALNLTIKKGELFFVLGGNGSGKTTALLVASDINKPYSGNVRVFGKKLKDYKNRSLYKNCLAMLVQNVQSVFLKNTVREELDEVGAVLSSLPYDLSMLADKHPYDLSGGEQQLVALAKVLASKPRLLLLDEPTKAIDAYTKKKIADILTALKNDGVTVVVVTHDVEFAAEYADRCAMFFRGEIVSIGTPSEFFSQNNFYTTASSRMTRNYFDGAVTSDDIIKLCRANKRGTVND